MLGTKSFVFKEEEEKKSVETIASNALFGLRFRLS